jgi:ribosome modulation factor
MKKRAPRLEHPTAYYQGRADRQAGRCRLSQPYDHLTVDCGWWLAGWNDKDMEI